MAPPPGRRALVPVLRPGDLLAGRYRLQVAVLPRSGAEPDEDAEPAAPLWRAVDEVLARPVAVRLLRAPGSRGTAAARPFLDAAAVAGTVSSPRLARVDDAAVEARPAERGGRAAGTVDVAYVVREWVEGRPLAEVLAEGPLEPLEAARQVAALAEALHAAHARGIAHGRVHPGNVVVTPTGELRLTDLALASALPDAAVPAEREGDPEGAAADVRDLTAVLYALLTARWPTSATPQPAGGLPAAPAGREREDRPRGRLASPRQVRAGVPRGVDELVVRVLAPVPARPVPATALALADALEAAVRADTPRAVVPRPPRVPGWVRRRVPLVLALAFLVLVGFVSYGVGRDVGEIAPPDDALSAGAPAPEPVVIEEPVDLASVPVVSFDPPPGDGEESPGEVPNAVDGDPATVWTTERYVSRDVGGKGGVGLLVDLGGLVPVVRVELVTTGGGVDVELRVADAAGATTEDYRVVATGTAREPGLVLTPPAGTTARYWLVRVVGLPPDGDGFRAGLAELRFVRG